MDAGCSLLSREGGSTGRRKDGGINGALDETSEMNVTESYQISAGQAGAVSAGAGYTIGMSRSSTSLVVRAWIALVAFVFSLFAPNLSHAFPAQRPMPASEVCSAAGMTMMPSADSPDGAPHPAKGMSHCDLCCSHHAPVMLPAPPVLFSMTAGARDTYPALFYQSPAPQFAWTPAQSRAPPASFS